MQPTINKPLHVPRINERVQIKSCHHQFHEIFHNIPKTITLHHSMNFFMSIFIKKTYLHLQQNLTLTCMIHQTEMHHHSLQFSKCVFFPNYKQNWLPNVWVLDQWMLSQKGITKAWNFCFYNQSPFLPYFKRKICSYYCCIWKINVIVFTYFSFSCYYHPNMPSLTSSRIIGYQIPSLQLKALVLQ